MNVIARAQKVLQSAESELRRLASEAVNGGEYENVLVLTEWAKQLTRITEDQRDEPSRLQGDPAEEEADTTTGGKNGYPRFVRANDSLIKVGWSKRKNVEYEHRVPREVVIALIAAFSRGGARKRPVPIEALMPLRSRQNSPIPNYQVYVALSFLRIKEIVEQHGRQGYTLAPKRRDPLALADELWNSLPSHAGA